MNDKITINNTYLKYSWRWKIKEDACLICQQEFNTACYKCRHPIDCVPCLGSCNHLFHYHCMSEWLEASQVCPVCRSPWVIKKIFNYRNRQ